ncbi:MAG: PEP-CTERM sorting domain-containing protein [Luteolibacter sp.]
MKLTIATAALITTMSGFATAATVNVNGYINVNFTTNAAQASTLGSGYTAKVGRYTGGTLLTTATFTEINAAWTNVGNYTFATAAAGSINGGFKGNAISFADTAGLAGTNVWLWVTNGSNQNLVMQATTSAVGDFLFKADGDIPNGGNLAVSTAARPGWQLSLGTFTTSGANSTYGGSYVLNTAAVVPEPSAALLGAFGAVGLLRRRRN